MNEVEKHTLSVEDQKARIRQRYKGINTDLIDIIPCITQDDFYNDTSEKRVAVYARVSTDALFLDTPSSDITSLTFINLGFIVHTSISLFDNEDGIIITTSDF